MSESAKVVRIDTGDEIASVPGRSNAALVSLLERLLQQARDGEIQGVSGAVTYPATEGYLRSAASFWAGAVDAFSSVGALEDAKYCMLRRLNEA